MSLKHNSLEIRCRVDFNGIKKALTFDVNA